MPIERPNELYHLQPPSAQRFVPLEPVPAGLRP